MAVTTMRLAELDGLGDPPADDPEVVERRVAALVADPREPRRSDAYNEIGDGRRAFAVGGGCVTLDARRTRTGV